MKERMDRPERTEKDDTQKTKLIFLSLAALVTILLVWSLYAATKARTDRDLAVQEAEMQKQEVAKLETILRDQNTEIEALKTKLQQCEAKLQAKPQPKPKAKPAAKKKAAPAKKKPSKRR
jgi:Skp family chaperone for outer membrane proteins